jgi:hypothetical protein
VLLRFAGGDMREALLPALAHLETAAVSEPELTVHIWDSASTSTSPPAPAWDLEDYREHGVIRGFFGDGFYTVFQWGTRALNVVDSASANAYFWADSVEAMRPPERGAPLRTLLHMWLSEHGVQLVHGAAVGRPDGCVLLVGSSGAGKTTTSLACLDSDLRHLGEDYCLATPGVPPEIASLYNSAKVEPATLERLPRLKPLVVAPPSPGSEKALIDLHAAMPAKLLGSAPLRAVAVPRITGERTTRVSRCSSGAALAALAPSTLLQLPGTGREALDRLTSIVSAVPCHQLELGTDLESIPAAIESILDEP